MSSIEAAYNEYLASSRPGTKYLLLGVPRGVQGAMVDGPIPAEFLEGLAWISVLSEPVSESAISNLLEPDRLVSRETGVLMPGRRCLLPEITFSQVALDGGTRIHRDEDALKALVIGMAGGAMGLSTGTQPGHPDDAIGSVHDLSFALSFKDLRVRSGGRLGERLTAKLLTLDPGSLAMPLLGGSPYRWFLTEGGNRHCAKSNWITQEVPGKSMQVFSRPPTEAERAEIACSAVSPSYLEARVLRWDVFDEPVDGSIQLQGRHHLLSV